ncbi:MAG: nucleotide exchange factor GrpE [Gemmatimonadaceae bacterium]
MRQPRDLPEDTPMKKPGAPGTEDQFARGASTTNADRPAGDVEQADGSAAEPDEIVQPDDDTMLQDGDGDSATRELEEQKERYLRLAAEYDNFRRRSTKERLEAGTRAQANLLQDLLEALDDLARFAHVDPATVDAATVVEGAGMVERKMLKALDAAGLEILSPVDEPFDPARHEAVATERALSSEDDGLVALVYQPGYLFNGQLLRPARVVVKQWNG